jgi:hypothetical protein
MSKTKMMLAGLGLSLSAAVLAAAPASAHHSTAVYDDSKIVSISGTVVKWEWTNPHTWLEMQADGQKWELESASPSILSRVGLNRTTFKPGDKVTVTLHQRRDKTLVGNIQAVQVAGGKTVQLARQRPGGGAAE